MKKCCDRVVVVWGCKAVSSSTVCHGGRHVNLQLKGNFNVSPNTRTNLNPVAQVSLQVVSLAEHFAAQACTWIPDNPLQKFWLSSQFQSAPKWPYGGTSVVDNSIGHVKISGHCATQLGGYEMILDTCVVWGPSRGVQFSLTPELHFYRGWAVLQSFSSANELETLTVCHHDSCHAILWITTVPKKKVLIHVL